MDDSKFAMDWEQTRQRGFWRFVASRGVAWGIFLAVFILVGVWLDGDPFDPLRFALMLALGFAAGCVYAPLSWYNREARYKYFVEDSSGR